MTLKHPGRSLDNSENIKY